MVHTANFHHFFHREKNMLMICFLRQETSLLHTLMTSSDVWCLLLSQAYYLLCPSSRHLILNNYESNSLSEYSVMLWMFAAVLQCIHMIWSVCSTKDYYLYKFIFQNCSRSREKVSSPTDSPPYAKEQYFKKQVAAIS